MKLTESQFTKLKEIYAQFIVWEDMDDKSLRHMAYDLLIDAYNKCSEDEIKNEIRDLYDQETLDGFMEEAVA